MLDLAFAATARGRIDFARNKEGDFFLDDRSVYAVFATLFARKGQYAFDGDVGTFLFKLTKDGRTTGTRLQAVADDSSAQLVQEGLVVSPKSSPQRLRTGAWSVTCEWLSPGGNRQREELRL